jgi:phage gp36-like protein
MYFLTPQDFETVIPAAQLQKMLTNPQITATPDQLLSQAVSAAIDEVVSYISGRYDLELAFTQSGSERNNILVLRMVDMALYHLYATIAPQNIPDLRRDRYAEAIELFKGVGKGTRFLNLPLKVIEEKTSFFLFASNPQYRYY